MKENIAEKSPELGKKKAKGRNIYFLPWWVEDN